MKVLSKHFWLFILDYLLKRPNIENGFLPDVIQEEDHHLLGGERKVLLPSKDWRPYRSAGEQQKRANSSETMACTIYSTLNVCETIMNRMKVMVDNKEADEETQELVKIFKHFDFYEDDEANLSDPFTAKMSGTSYRGNTFNNVFNSIRNDGLIAEKFWATPEQYSWNEYYKDIPQAIKDKAKRFTNYVEVKYERINASQFNQTKIYSPNTTSVYAGAGWNNASIKPRATQRHNHAVDNDAFEDRQYDLIFDSYLPYEKKVSWNYGLGSGRIVSFWLKKKLKNKYEELLSEGIKYIIRPESKGEFYEVTPNGFEYHSKEDIDNVIADDTDLNTNLKELTKQKKVMWVNEDWFKKYQA